MTSNKEKIRFALLGCGYIGRKHAALISAHPEAELVAIADTDTEARHLLGATVPTAIAYPSLEAMLAGPEAADAVVIATPNGHHAEAALVCLAAGKHIVLEKPIALTKADAERIIFRALSAHKHVFGVMQNRYSPPARWLKGLVDDGTLGPIYLVTMTCFWNRDARYYSRGTWHGTKALDGGTLFTQFSHFIDILYWIFGDIQDISARMTSFNHAALTEFEDSGLVTFRLADGGGLGSLAFSTSVWDKNMESSMTVVAGRGSVKLGGQYMDRVEYCHIQDFPVPDLPPADPGHDYGAYRGSAAAHHHVIDNVVDVLKGRASVATNALEGLKVVEMIERIYAASSER